MEESSCFKTGFMLYFAQQINRGMLLKEWEGARMETSETCFLLKSGTGTQLIIVYMVVRKHVFAASN